MSESILILRRALWYIATNYGIDVLVIEILENFSSWRSFYRENSSGDLKPRGFEKYYYGL
jgi:hypothetical protein